MDAMKEQHRTGVEYLETVTTLLQRVRISHPTKGLYEAAELLWWWGETPRTTDNLAQLFWLDDRDQPEAAVIITDWREWISLDPIVLPNATPEWVAHVIERGLAHAHGSGFVDVQLEVDRADGVMRDVLTRHGFTHIEED